MNIKAQMVTTIQFAGMYRKSYRSVDSSHTPFERDIVRNIGTDYLEELSRKKVYKESRTRVGVSVLVCPARFEKTTEMKVFHLLKVCIHAYHYCLYFELKPLVAGIE